MKTLLLVLLFVSSFTHADAPPTINNPSPLTGCDFNNGFAILNLNIAKFQTLTDLTDVLSFHHTQNDAENNVNPIPEANYNNYINANPNFEILYIRVTDPNFPNEPAFTTVNIIVIPQIIPTFSIPDTVCEYAINSPLPTTSANGITGTWSPAIINPNTNLYTFTPDGGICAAPTTVTITVIPAPTVATPSNLIQNDNPFDGFASFDLNAQVTAITMGASGLIVGFHTSLTDAQTGANAIANPSGYVNTTNPETISVRVADPVTGCYTITSFDLIVINNVFPINNPTPLSACDTNNNLFETFDLTVKNSEILGALNPNDYVVQYYSSFNDAINNLNVITNPSAYVNAAISPTLGVRVASPTGDFSYTTLHLVLNPTPQLPATIPNLTVYENPFDGVAVFNLDSHTTSILNGPISPAITIDYYTSQADAYAQANAIPNTTTFNGIDGQVIWVNVKYVATGCSTISSFMLRVFDSALVVYIPDVNFKTLLLNSNAVTGVAANSGFQPIVVDTNDDGEIQFSEALLVYSIDVLGQNINTIEGISAFTNLGWFRCTNNNLTSVDLSANTNLTKLQIGQNQLTTLNVSMLTNLVWLVCDNNLLTSLNVLPLVNLEVLDCRYNQLSTIDVSSLSNIYTLDLSHNQLTSLDLNGTEDVVQLILQNNQLASIDLSMLTQVNALYLSNNNLSTVDLSNLQSASIIDLSFNNLTTVDASQNTSLTFIGCSNNNLESLFVKNGSNEGNFNNQYVFSNNPSLAFICADEFQIEAIQNNLAAIGNTTCVVNSYCSFTPGGNYNTITGTAKIDGNSNGCDNLDNVAPFLGLQVSLNGTATNEFVFTNGVGIYNLYTSIPGIYQLATNLENPTYFNTATVDVDSNTINNSTIIQDICVTPNGVHPDVEVVLAPITPARPGFNATYQLVYKNKGNQTLSGAITFNFDDSRLDLVSANPTVSSQNNGLLTWNYSNLQPFEHRSISFMLNVNSPVEVPAVNNGDVLVYNVAISPATGDETPADNSFILNQTVVGSYDPNDISCLEGDTVAPVEIGNYLHYIINFENTGNFYAENVVVQDIIDTAKYDIGSLQILNASHDMEARINGNKVEFVFEHINLAAVGGNPPVGGHGNVLFKIRSRGNLVANDFVSKRANIYFDYNAPITTNDALTTFVLLSNAVLTADNSISISPNPTNGILDITGAANLTSYELYDVQGRILEKSFVDAGNIRIDISNRESGLYFLKITSEKGSKIEKVIRK